MGLLDRLKSKDKGGGFSKDKGKDLLSMPPLPDSDMPHSLSGMDMDASMPQMGTNQELPDLSSEDMMMPNGHLNGPESERLNEDWKEFAESNKSLAGIDDEPALDEKPLDQPRQARAAPMQRQRTAPSMLFVDMDTYYEFLAELPRITDKLKGLDLALSRLGSLREKEELELRRWHQSFDDMRKKLLYIDDAIFEPKLSR